MTPFISYDFDVSLSNDQFPLTFRRVMCKQHSAVFPNQVPSFNLREKEDLEWFLNIQNPVTLNRKRAGLFVLWLNLAVKDKSIKDVTPSQSRDFAVTQVPEAKICKECDLKALCSAKGVV